MNTTTYRFLFPMWEGGGTIPPQLGVARRLLDRGHHVHVLADPTVEDDALAAGCTFSSWRRAPHRTTLDPAEDLLRDWEDSNPFAMLRRVRDVFVATPAAAYAADTLDAIESVRPHASSCLPAPPSTSRPRRFRTTPAMSDLSSMSHVGPSRGRPRGRPTTRPAGAGRLQLHVPGSGTAAAEDRRCAHRCRCGPS